jgi:hypothetical protein
LDTPPLIEHRKNVSEHAREVFRACSIEFERTSELQRQVSGAFLFGVVSAYGMSCRLSPPDVHALAVSMLIDVLHYSPEQAGAFLTQLLEATRAGPNDTMNAIIHRGIDGHRQLLQSDHNGLSANLLGIFKTLKDPYAA